MNKITHYSVILVLVSALLLLPACTPVTDNSDAHIAALITELRTLLKSLYNSQTNTIYANTNSDDLGALSVQVTAIQEAGAANKIESEHIQITALRTGFIDKCTEFHTQFAALNAKVENNYTADSWKAFTQAKTPIDESVPYTYGKITEKIDTITTALSILVTKDGNGSENPPTEEETPETPDGVGEAIINKPILFNGTDLIFDDLPIGTSTKTITLTINKDPATTTDKISLKLISDLQRELEGTGETKRTVNLILGAGMNGYTLNGPDALNLHVGDYDGVKVSEIKPEDLEHKSSWENGEFVKESMMRYPQPRIVIDATRDIVLSGNFNAFYTEIKGKGLSKENVNNIKLITEKHPRDPINPTIIPLSVADLRSYIGNLPVGSIPSLDIVLYNRGQGVENLYDTLYPTAKDYLKDDNTWTKFDVKGFNGASNGFELDGLTAEEFVGKTMFTSSNLNGDYAKIDARALMKFKELMFSVQNLIVEGTVPAGELLNGKNLAFTGDASKLAKVSIGDIMYYGDEPARHTTGGSTNDYIILKKNTTNFTTIAGFTSIDILALTDVSNLSKFGTAPVNYANYYSRDGQTRISGIGANSNSTTPPDYEKIWTDLTTPAASKSSRVISAQQQKTR